MLGIETSGDRPPVGGVKGKSPYRDGVAALVHKLESENGLQVGKVGVRCGQRAGGVYRDNGFGSVSDTCSQAILIIIRNFAVFIDIVKKPEFVGFVDGAGKVSGEVAVLVIVAEVGGA